MPKSILLLLALMLVSCAIYCQDSTQTNKYPLLIVQGSDTFFLFTHDQGLQAAVVKNMAEDCAKEAEILAKKVRNEQAKVENNKADIRALEARVSNQEQMDGKRTQQLKILAGDNEMLEKENKKLRRQRGFMGALALLALLAAAIF